MLAHVARVVHNGEELVAHAAYKYEVARYGYSEGNMLRMTQQRNIIVRSPCRAMALSMARFAELNRLGAPWDHH